MSPPLKAQTCLRTPKDHPGHECYITFTHYRVVLVRAVPVSVSQSKQHPHSKHAGADIFVREFVLASLSPAVTAVHSTSIQDRPQSLLATARFARTLWLALRVCRLPGLSRSIYVDSALR